MPRVTIRMSEKQEQEAKRMAALTGHFNADGTPNVSSYLRALIAFAPQLMKLGWISPLAGVNEQGYTKAPAETATQSKNE